MAYIYFSEDNLEKVEILLQEALQIDKRNPNTWNAIAVLKEKQEKIEEFRRP